MAYQSLTEKYGPKKAVAPTKELGSELRPNQVVKDLVNMTGIPRAAATGIQAVKSTPSLLRIGEAFVRALIGDKEGAASALQSAGQMSRELGVTGDNNEILPVGENQAAYRPTQVGGVDVPLDALSVGAKVGSVVGSLGAGGAAMASLPVAASTGALQGASGSAGKIGERIAGGEQPNAMQAVELGADTALGAGTSAAFYGISKGVGSLVDKFKKSNSAGKAFERLYKPPTKEIAAGNRQDAWNAFNAEAKKMGIDNADEVTMQFKRVGDRIADATDDAGKPLFIGDLDTDQKTAVKTIAEGSKQAKEILKKLGDKGAVVRKPTLAEAIRGLEVDQRFGEGMLDEKQVEYLARKIAKLPKEVDPVKGIEIRQLHDKLLGPGFWQRFANNGGDVGPQLSMPDNVDYFIRNYYRQALEEGTDDAIKPIMQKIGLASDVLDMASYRQAALQTNRNFTYGAPKLRNFIDGLWNLIANPVKVGRAIQNIPSGVTAGGALTPVAAALTTGALTVAGMAAREATGNVAEEVYSERQFGVPKADYDAFMGALKNARGY